MLDFTVKKVYDTILKFNMINENDKILVGFSGGADSLFLIHSLMELQNYINFELFAAHLNHGIRGNEADSDETFVFNYCKKNKIRLFTKKVDIPQIASQSKISDEVAGRNERYRFFNEICTDNAINKIAVAHNKNDSVETVILNLIRGASLSGLCGIKPIHGNIIRPIIDISRTEIEDFLKTRKINYCTDSTNLTDIYTRNKIRNSILNTMTEINSSVIDTVYSNMHNLNNDDNFIKSYCEKLNCITESDDEIIVNMDILRHEHISVKNRVLLMAFEKLKGNTSNISSSHLSIILNADKTGKSFNMPDNITVKTSYNNIVFSYKNKTNDDYSYKLKVDIAVEYLKNKFILCTYCDYADLNEENTVYIDVDKVNINKLTVRNRRNGDRFIPYGMNGEKKIKNFFIDLKLPKNKRDEIPILTDNDVIAAIVPYRVSELYKVTKNTKKILKIKIYGEV